MAKYWSHCGFSFNMVWYSVIWAWTLGFAYLCPNSRVSSYTIKEAISEEKMMNIWCKIFRTPQPRNLIHEDVEVNADWIQDNL